MNLSDYDKSGLPEEIAQRFLHHPPSTPAVANNHEQIRLATALFASVIYQTVPSGRHQALSLTALEEAMHWANSGIACDPSNRIPDVEDTQLPPEGDDPIIIGVG